MLSSSAAWPDAICSFKGHFRETEILREWIGPHRQGDGIDLPAELPDLVPAEFDFEEFGGRLDGVATFHAPEVEPDTSHLLIEELERELQRPVLLRIVSIPVVETDADL